MTASILLGALVLSLQAAVLPPAISDRAAQGSAAGGSSVFGVFVGSSPCDQAIRHVLSIPPSADAELIEWDLTLYTAARVGEAAQYHLPYRYGLTVAGRPGLGRQITAREKRGTWRVERTDTSPAAETYELEGVASLSKISETVLHLLTTTGKLMVGDSGWSYTLNRRDASDPLVNPSLEAQERDQPRSISAVSTDPTVFGVFEGRKHAAPRWTAGGTLANRARKQYESRRHDLSAGRDTDRGGDSLVEGRRRRSFLPESAGPPADRQCRVQLHPQSSPTEPLKR